jgi:hypothetical protein
MAAEHGKLAGTLRSGGLVVPWKYHDIEHLWDAGACADGKMAGEWKVYDKAGALEPRKLP